MTIFIVSPYKKTQPSAGRVLTLFHLIYCTPIKSNL